MPHGMHLIDLGEFEAEMDDLPEDLTHWLDELADERDLDDLSQDPLVNDRPSFDQDAYYDGLGEP